MSTRLEDRYTKLPACLQAVGINLFGLFWKWRRYGGNFEKYVREFKLRENYSQIEWDGYENKKLQQLLVYANSFVPHYRELFHNLGLFDKDLQTFTRKDFLKLPILTKDDIRRDPDSFLSERKIKKINTYQTSGTTGLSIDIKVSLEADRQAQAAYEARVRNWAGVNFKMSRGMIGGRIIVPRANEKPPFWRYNAVERQLYLSAFHISHRNAPYYAEALNHYQPDYLVGYACSHFFLARMFEELSIPMYRPKAVLTSSEKLTSEMRATLERVYSCEVFDAYSSVEICCQASECECHQMHISPDMGLVELLDEHGKSVPAGVPGRIIATGFINFAQPLIRYDTGDLAILSTKTCSCGRKMPVFEELVGRIEDTVITRDGKEVVRFTGLFHGITNVKEVQVVQETYDFLRLRIVALPGFNDLDKKLIKERIYQRVGEMNLQFELVDVIERTSRGKFKAVISHVHHKNPYNPDTSNT